MLKKPKQISSAGRRRHPDVVLIVQPEDFQQSDQLFLVRCRKGTSQFTLDPPDQRRRYIDCVIRINRAVAAAVKFKTLRLQLIFHLGHCSIRVRKHCVRDRAFSYLTQSIVKGAGSIHAGDSQQLLAIGQDKTLIAAQLPHLARQNQQCSLLVLHCLKKICAHMLTEPEGVLFSRFSRCSCHFAGHKRQVHDFPFKTFSLGITAITGIFNIKSFNLKSFSETDQLRVLHGHLQPFLDRKRLNCYSLCAYQRVFESG